MSKVRQKLTALPAECESLCEKAGWLGYVTRRPNFRLRYSSVESYDHDNGFAVFGLNQGGDGTDADTNDRDRPFRDPGFSAYLDSERLRPNPMAAMNDLLRFIVV